MRKIIPFLILSIIALTATSQKFTIQPQIGLENPVSEISVNDMTSFQMAKAVISPTFGLRMDYRFKGGHGPYIGVSSTRPTVTYTFIDVSAAPNEKLKTGDAQFQLQAGYQLSTKKIFLNAPSASKSSYSSASKSSYSSAKKSCGSYVVRSHCGSKPSMARVKSSKNIPYVQLIPSAGIAYKPFMDEALVSKTQGSQKIYTYNAGGSKLAVNAGMGFEFGMGNRKSFSVSVNYFRSVGESEAEFSSAPDATKPSITNVIESETSGWNATLGFPFSFSKASKSSKQHREYSNQYKEYKIQKTVKKSCGESEVKKSCHGK